MATSSRATTNPSSRPSSETSDPQVVIAAVTGAPDSDEVIAQASMIASAVGARLFGLPTSYSGVLNWRATGAPTSRSRLVMPSRAWPSSRRNRVLLTWSSVLAADAGGRC